MPKQKKDSLKPVNSAVSSLLKNDGTKDIRPTVVEEAKTTKVKKPAKKAPAKPKTTTTQKVGRPAKGKSSSKDYKQVTALLRKDLHKLAKQRILDLEDTENEIDFSDLLNQALEKHLT